MQTIIWRNIELAVPPDWEMLQYSLNRERGRCAMADRYQIRFEWNWRMVEGAPDFDRMIGDYQTQLAEQKKVLATHAETVAGWRGFHGRLQDQTTMSRFARYFVEEKLLLETVFLWPAKRDAQLEYQVLSTARYVAPTADNSRRWKAFGLEITVPGTLPPRRLAVEPARVAFRFGKRKDETYTQEYRRLGMTAEWLQVPVPEWLQKQSGRLTDRASRTHGGHEIHTATFELKLAFLHRFRGLKLRRRAEAWICPEDERLYYAEETRRMPESEKMKCLAGSRLRCCPALS